MIEAFYLSKNTFLKYIKNVGTLKMLWKKRLIDLITQFGEFNLSIKPYIISFYNIHLLNSEVQIKQLN